MSPPSTPQRSSPLLRRLVSAIAAKIAAKLLNSPTTEATVPLVNKIATKLQERSAPELPATEKSVQNFAPPSPPLVAKIAAKLLATEAQDSSLGRSPSLQENGSLDDCSLSIMVARTDLGFLRHTIPHLVKMCRYPFRERVLFVDTAPLSGDKLKRPDIGSMEQLLATCQNLLAQGVVDRISEIDYNPQLRQEIYRKHFGFPLHQTHNWKGYPIYGSLYSLEAVQGNYVLHFDSDMLLYQSTDYNWIETAIALMKKRGEVAAVRPLAGPPATTGEMFSRVAYRGDPDGFYGFKFFSSRAYLLNRRRFEELLPMSVLWKGTRHAWYNALPNTLRTYVNHHTGRDKLDSWELMVSQQLETGPWLRAMLTSPQAWTLHPNFRSPEFFAALPQLIEKIEAGWFPAAQAGHYDLILEPWLAAIDSDQFQQAMEGLSAAQRASWNLRAAQNAPKLVS